MRFIRLPPSGFQGWERRGRSDFRAKYNAKLAKLGESENTLTTHR